MQTSVLIKENEDLLDGLHDLSGLVLFVLRLPKATPAFLERPRIDFGRGSKGALQHEFLLVGGVFGPSGLGHLRVPAVGGRRHGSSGHLN